MESDQPRILTGKQIIANHNNSQNQIITTQMTKHKDNLQLKQMKNQKILRKNLYLAFSIQKNDCSLKYMSYIYM